MDGIDNFIEQLMDDKGLGRLDEDVRSELKKDLTEKLLTQIDRAAIEALPEEKAIEFAGKLDDPNFSREDAMKFMEESGVDFTDAILQTMVAFRALYIGEGEQEAR